MSPACKERCKDVCKLVLVLRKSMQAGHQVLGLDQALLLTTSVFVPLPSHPLPCRSMAVCCQAAVAAGGNSSTNMHLHAISLLA